MDIDLSVLKFIEREKEIPFNELVSIIEAAILAAYQKHVGNSEPARAELSKSTGHVNIYAPVLDEEGVKTGETEVTPENFGRVAAAAASAVAVWPGSRADVADRRAC